MKDELVLKGTLLQSPEIDGRCQVIAKSGYSSASQAYNAGILDASAEIMVLAHTDVYFPLGWLDKLKRAIESLETSDPNWGVLGVCGLALDGGVGGHVYSTGSRRFFGNPFERPIPTHSLDEMVLILRRSSGLRFDDHLPGFHLYGTDICLEARQQGMKSYIVPAFCLHNSVGIGCLPRSFWEPYFYLRRKWRMELPIATCCAKITMGYGFFLKSILASLRQRIKPSALGDRHPHPEKLCKDLGY